MVLDCMKPFPLSPEVRHVPPALPRLLATAPAGVSVSAWGHPGGAATLAQLGTLLVHARARLQVECERAGKDVLFRELAGMLTGERDFGYAEIAGRLGMSEDAVKKAAQRLRGRYQVLLREEIAQTVSSREEVEEELRWLIATLHG